MLHPLVIGAIVVGGVVVLWGGYEVASKIYDEFKEREQYQEYLREYNGRRYQREKFSDDEDDEPLINTLRRESSGLRNRRKFSAHSDEVSKEEFELSEMESRILERKRRLEQEQAFLDKQEEELKARRSALFEDLETDVTRTNHLVVQDNPMTFNPFSTDFDDENDDQSTMFKPNLINDEQHVLSPKDTTSVTEDGSASEEEEEEQSNNIYSSSSSSELRFPAAPRSIPSDSEESWDAVTDEWAHTDSEDSFADPMSSEDNFDGR